MQGIYIEQPTNKEQELDEECKIEGYELFIEQETTMYTNEEFKFPQTPESPDVRQSILDTYSDHAEKFKELLNDEGFKILYGDL